jgi:hypothetical protein
VESKQGMIEQEEMKILLETVEILLRAAILVIVIAWLPSVVIAFLKGKIFCGLAGTVGVFVATVIAGSTKPPNPGWIFVMMLFPVIGALRLAKPQSRWARKHYDDAKITRGFIAIAAVIFAVVVIKVAIKNNQLRSTSGSSNAAAFDPQYEAAAESYLQNLGMEKFTSKEFGFSVMMPKQNAPVKMDIGTMFRGEINDYSTMAVIVKDLPPSDPDYDANFVRFKASFVLGLSRSQGGSNVEVPRSVKDRNGHIGIEYTYMMHKGDLDYLGKGHAFQVEHRIYIAQVMTLKTQWDKELADNVLATFSID